MKRLRPRPSALGLALVLLLAGAAGAQEEAAPSEPLLTVSGISVEPPSPAADTLCRLRVRLTNAGDKIASRLHFAVRLNGQELAVYGNQIFMQPIEPGASEEVSLYNFWTTETSRPMPTDGKLRVEVTLEEAVWTKVSTETDEEGEIEVWAPIGPVENLPSTASVTLDMKAGG